MTFIPCFWLLYDACFAALFGMASVSRLTANGKSIPARVFITNDSGYFVDIDMYLEEEDPKSRAVRTRVSDLFIAVCLHCLVLWMCNDPSYSFISLVKYITELMALELTLIRLIIFCFVVILVFAFAKQSCWNWEYLRLIWKDMRLISFISACLQHELKDCCPIFSSWVFVNLSFTFLSRKNTVCGSGAEFCSCLSCQEFCPCSTALFSVCGGVFAFGPCSCCVSWSLFSWCSSPSTEREARKGLFMACWLQHRTRLKTICRWAQCLCSEATLYTTQNWDCRNRPCIAMLLPVTNLITLVMLQASGFSAF